MKEKILKCDQCGKEMEVGYFTGKFNHIPVCLSGITVSLSVGDVRKFHDFCSIKCVLKWAKSLEAK